MREPGYDVLPGDVVEVNGRIIAGPEKTVYYLLNKPLGFITSAKDEEGRPTVLDIVKAFEKANAVEIPYVIKDRRAGDIATCYANPDKAKAELGWQAEFDLERMCKDSWNFARKYFNV